MSFGDHPFKRFNSFNPESKLSEFRKRFEDLTQNNRSHNMLFRDRDLDTDLNGWPLRLNNRRNMYSMGRNTNLNDMSDTTKTSESGEEDGIPIKVIHETSNASNESPIEGNEDRNELNSDTHSSVGSSHSHKSTAQQSCSSGNSTNSGNVFHSNASQSQPFESSVEPRVHHIPIKVEPRDGSTSSGYTSEPNTAEQPLSRSSSSSSRHSAQSGGSRSSNTARSPSPTKSVSSSHSNVSSNSSNTKPRVCQIPIKVETNDSQKSRSPLKSDNIPKVKTNGLAQSHIKGTKTKSGPFVTRIPVVGEADSSSHPQSFSSQTPTKEQNKKSDPLEVINRILNDLQKYEIEVNQFNGTPNDKRYRYLDEMLTRCMIKLDTIETHGKEDVRKARKAAVIAVNKCIALLESRVKTDVNNQTNEISGEQMVVSTPEPTNVPNDIAVENVKPNEEQVEQMQVDVEPTPNSQEKAETNQNTNIELPLNTENKDNKSPGNGRKETAV